MSQAEANWERARNPEQKAARRDEILRAAKRLFAENNYAEISLNGIAREAGFSKPNVYRYFSTREEIFLSIFEQEQGKLVDAILTRLKRIRAKDPVEAICRIWSEEMLNHKDWLDLVPYLAMSMEENSSVDQIIAFKKVGYQRLTKLIEALQAVYPKLTHEQWFVLMQSSVALIAGLWPLANPGEKVIEATMHPEVNQPTWDFKSILERSMGALIRGMELEKGVKK